MGYLNVLLRYRRLLSEIDEVSPGFRFRVPNLNSGQTRWAILRHDIDFSPSGILKMGELEARLGHQAIYLFRPDATSYNFNSIQIQQTVQGLRNQGHEIGLHFDRRTLQLQSKSSDPNEKLLEFYQSKLNIDINFFSWHRPLQVDLGGNDSYIGLSSLYSNAFWNMQNYVSDSAGNWSTEKEIRLLALISNADNLQLLIHPEWWLTDTPSSSFALSYLTQIDLHFASFKNEIRSYSELHLQDSILNNLIKKQNS